MILTVRVSLEKCSALGNLGEVWDGCGDGLID